MTKKIMFESPRSQNNQPHRSRELPAPDPGEQPLSQIKFYLDRYKIKEALQVFYNDNTLTLLREDWDFIWELIPLICRRLRGLCQYRFRVFEGCEKMLCRIAGDQFCNPKEVLIVLLAEISHQSDDHDDDNVLRAMIRPLELILKRIDQPVPRSENLKWVLSVLISYIQNIDLIPDEELDGVDRKLLSNHPRFKRFTQILPSLIGLIDEFSEGPQQMDRIPSSILTDEKLKETSSGELNDDIVTDMNDNSACHRSNACVSALTSMMHRPLASLDLTKDRPDFRIISARCLIILLRLRSNLFAPIYKNLGDNISNAKNVENYNSESMVSLATCAYIYRCERAIFFEGEHCFPRIISNEVLLTSHLPYIASLLESSESLVQEKGLLLLESLLSPIKLNSLDESYLSCLETSSVNRRLLHIMVYGVLDTNRKRAYELFVLICDLLNHYSKVEVFKNILNQDHLRSSVRAICIDQFRRHLTTIYRQLITLSSFKLNNLTSSLKESTSQNNTGVSNLDSVIRDIVHTNRSCHEEPNEISGPFDFIQRLNKLQHVYKLLGGQTLVDFLELCINACLPDGMKTDVLELYDILLATLNLFRFLKLRKHLTDDSIEMGFLQGGNLARRFFEPLQNNLSATREELKAYIRKNDQSNNKSEVKKPTDCHGKNSVSRLLSLYHSDKNISKDGVKHQEDANCLEFILCQLDLMASVLVRTRDLYDV